MDKLGTTFYLICASLFLSFSPTYAEELPDFKASGIDRIVYYETGEKKEEHCSDNLIHRYRENGEIISSSIHRHPGIATRYIYNSNGIIERVEEIRNYELRRTTYYDDHGKVTEVCEIITRSNSLIYACILLLVLAIGYSIFTRIASRKRLK